MTSTLTGLLAVFDVDQSAEGFVGGSDAGDRDVIDGSQLLAQAIVAASKLVPAKTVRNASAVFCRPVRAHEAIQFGVEVVQDGRTFATVAVRAMQGGRTCATITLLLDAPSADVIRHPAHAPSSTPGESIELHMPVVGREIRLVGVSDPNDPDEVGPAELDAWVRYSPTPSRDELRRALLAHFTGHLSISTTMRAHAGIGTSMAHRTISTAVMSIAISFHDPVEWDGWVLYSHESTSVGAGMSYVRGQIRDELGRLLASFSQDAMIRAFQPDAQANQIAERSRL